ncbi:ferredoxin [Dactylosporangium sp. NPDC051541]|uniref:ferredoxin n=1 Tax=Dactylosporangium sp. NPDC051541 TaxID=3363977 RepID=UPI0037951DCC
MWRITISDACIGSGSCVGVAPRHFELDDVEGRAHPVGAESEPDEAVLDAVANCPMEAITVVDLETGQDVEF